MMVDMQNEKSLDLISPSNIKEFYANINEKNLNVYFSEFFAKYFISSNCITSINKAFKFWAALRKVRSNVPTKSLIAMFNVTLL